MNNLEEDSEFYDFSLIKLHVGKHGTWNKKVWKMVVIVLGLKSGTLRDCG